MAQHRGTLAEVSGITRNLPVWGRTPPWKVAGLGSEELQVADQPLGLLLGGNDYKASPLFEFLYAVKDIGEIAPLGAPNIEGEAGKLYAVAKLAK